MGLVHKATVELADKAIEEAILALLDWKKVEPEIRARYLLKVAALMRRQKAELTALNELELE